MEVGSSSLWKFIIVDGRLVRECTNCGYRGKKQPVYCPNCNAYMRKK